MKKIMVTALLAVVAAFACFAANPESDFTFKLSNDAESVIITGVKNNLKAYDIPATIEELPVTVIEIKEDLGYKNKNEVTLKLPEGLKEFSLLQRSGVPEGHVIISGLPSSLEKCDIRSQQNKKNPNSYYITLNGSIKPLDKLTSFTAQYVEVKEKSLSVRKEWKSYDFLGSSFTDVTFEEGCETIYRFRNCKNITKVVLPASAKKINNEAFMFCTSLTEIVIPDSITTLDFGVNSRNFDGAIPPLKTQAKLKRLGYNGKFGNS